jgi:hypothetical protein
MKKLFLGIIIGLIAGGAAVWVYHLKPSSEPEKAEAKKEERRVLRDENDKPFLKLDKEFQSRAGLKITALEASELKPELKAFGRVLDPAPLAATITTIAAARAQLEASGKEAQRLKTLFNQNQNASARAYETAEAALKRDQIAVQATELAFVTTWGKDIAGRPDVDQLIHALVSQEASLVRVDVPASEKLDDAPAAARLTLLSAPDAPFDAEFLGATVSTDPQTLGRGFLFLVKGKAIAANAAVIAWLSLPGDKRQGVIVPRDAIVRHEAEAFVYVQATDETFQRFEVALAHPLASGWFTDGLKPGAKVVTTGAQQLLSEELKGQGGGE